MANENLKMFFAEQMQFGAANLLNTLLDKRFSNATTSGRNFIAIGGKCRQDLIRVSSGALRNERWALTVFDSNAKTPSGLMGGSLFNLIGNYDQCLEASLEPEGRSIGGIKYCQAQLDLSPESRGLASLTSLPEAIFRPDIIIGRLAKLGLCVPASCHPDDLTSLANHISSSAMNLNPSSLQVQSIQCSASEDQEFGQQPSLVGFTVFVLIMILIVGSSLWATIIDSPNRYKRTGSINVVEVPTSSIVSQEHQDGDNDKVSWFHRWIDTFSLVRAYRRMMTERNRLTANSMIDLNALDGLRVLSMFWTITMHSYNFGFQWLLYDNLKQVENVYRTPWIQWLANGTYSVDNFFLISGILVWFKHSNYIQTTKRFTNHKKEDTCDAATPVDGKSRRQQLLEDAKFPVISIGLRYLRLMPIMMLLILFSTTILPRLAYGPNWSYSTTMFDLWCRTNWPLNLGMVQNFISTSNMCFSHSWYVAVDFQLFALIQVILFVLLRAEGSETSPPSSDNRSLYYTLRRWILIIIIVMAQCLVAMVVYFKRLPSIPLIPADTLGYNSIIDYYGLIYIKPYYWLSSYLLGALLASCLLTSANAATDVAAAVPGGNSPRWHLNSSSGTLQVVPIVLMVALILTTWPYFTGTIQLTQLQSSLLTLITRPLWSLCTATILYYVCFRSRINLTDRLITTRLIAKLLTQSNLWLLPSRLSYSAFLLHPVIMAAFYGSRTETFKFSHSLLIYFTLGNLCLTYLGAFLIYLFIESPICSVIRHWKHQLLLHQRKPSKGEPKVSLGGRQHLELQQQRQQQFGSSYLRMGKLKIKYPSVQSTPT